MENNKTYHKVCRLAPQEHTLFVDQATGYYYLADDSGTPETCEDGPLLLLIDKPLLVYTDYVSARVRVERRREESQVMLTHEAAAKLVCTVTMGVTLDPSVEHLATLIRRVRRGGSLGG